AGWAGARAFTSTSGPGISLMAEFSGLAYYAEVPVVIFDIQRIGPSTGLPTRTSQADIGFVYTLSHGDTKHIVLLPGTVEECYEFARDAGHDENARYTEGADAYANNMDRLVRKLETARHALPAPVIDEAGSSVGLIAFGSTHAAVVEARETLLSAGKAIDYLRVRALPLSDDVAAFVERH